MVDTLLPGFLDDTDMCAGGGRGAGNNECQNQSPANVDASVYMLDFFNSLPGGSTQDVPKL